MRRWLVISGWPRCFGDGFVLIDCMFGCLLVNHITRIQTIGGAKPRRVSLHGEGSESWLASGNSSLYTSFHLCSSVVFGGTRFFILRDSSWHGSIVPSGNASVLVSQDTAALWCARRSAALLHRFRHLEHVCLPMVWQRYKCSLETNRQHMSLFTRLQRVLCERGKPYFTRCTVGQPGPQHVRFCRNFPGLFL